jgi:outer membrane protein TolC
MSRCTHFCGALVCALLSVAGSAHATEPQTLSLEQLLTELSQRSPELASRRAEVRAARERPAQARAFEDPMLMTELWQVPLGLQQLPLMFTLRQPIPWPGKLRARAAAVEPEIPRAQAEADSAARTLRLEATRAYYDYWLAIRTEEVLRENRRLLESIVLSVDARYRVGRAELAELLKAQEEAASLDNRLLDVDRERELAVAAINTLLARSPAEPLGKPVTQPVVRNLPDFAALTERALAERPELRGAQAALAQAQARIHAAEVERAPDLAVWAGFMAMLRGGTDHTFTVGLQTSIPSFSLTRSRAAGREAQAQVSAAQAALAQAQALIRGEVRQASLRLETAQRHIQLHGQRLLPLAERSVQAAQVAYQSGRVDLVLLLDAVRAFLDHRLEYERFLTDYAQRWADLEAAVGGGVP